METSLPLSDTIFVDTVFEENNASVSQEWMSITELYPDGVNNPLLPETFSREQFAQGNHYECFMLSALATLVRYPDVIRNCFVTQTPRRDGRYTFQFFRGKQWVMVEIDDRIAVEEGDVLFIRSPTEHWWPLLLEKAYAKFYMSYSHLDGCTMQEVFHDLTGNPVLNIPMDPKLAKAAGARSGDGLYWIELAEKLRTGELIASISTNMEGLEDIGMMVEQQYSILEIFSLTGTSAASDIVIRLHNPFEDEEYDYCGPMNRYDKVWTPKLRLKYDVDDRNSIFIPAKKLIEISNSIQICYMSTLDGDATYFDDEWAGETAGGNPTAVTWRKNPSYLVRNSGGESLPLTIMIKQDDQRRFTTAEENTKYVQCGIIVTRYSYPHPIPTKWITGNNHKPVFKSLFLNSRDVSNTVVIPPNSLCYLVPCCFSARSEARFSMAVYRTRGVDYSKLLFMKLSVPDMDWLNPATEEFTFPVKEKERVDFYVDEETDVHILLHQTKPYVNKNGGDAMTEDYMGVYVYDDTDNKVAGVHAATNFREMSVIHHLPRSGRFALSLTCPRAKSEVTGYVTIVASSAARVRIVDRPEDAGMFDNEDEQLDENEEDAQVANPIDYTAVAAPKCEIVEADDGNTPFEDKRFMLDNRTVTNEPWLHIGDLYPGGKKQALMPERLSREQFEQGDSVECCCLIAFAALAERHPQVIQNCFVTKRPRRDGRYTFRFHRYGHWVKVEIDDRIPVVDGGTVFCRSPTGHWWPLLLEKAYAKFYTSYQNMEGCTPQEVFHDFTGNPVLNLTLESKLAHYAGYDVTDMNFWAELRESLKSSALTALTQADSAEAIGLENDGAYAILDIVMPSAASDATQSNVLMKMHNPIVDREYTGPMNRSDEQWTEEMRGVHEPSAPGVFYMPLSTFLETFVTVQQLYVSGVLEPCWNFNSEWGEGTNGGNPTLVTWRQNPLYVVRNTADNPLQLIAMIRQPDQRHKMHQQIDRDLVYVKSTCALVRAYASASFIETYLLTWDNHTLVNTKSIVLSAREVSSVLTVPANSLCYLVPSSLQLEASIFMLSLWKLTGSDDSSLVCKRFQADVARDLPAVASVLMCDGEYKRVDFIVDVPTDVHICVRQERVDLEDKEKSALAENHIGLYLYNDQDKFLKGSTSVLNYRETSVVHRLPFSGRYTLVIHCPRGKGKFPCRVEVVALEAAHVRIIDTSDDTSKLIISDLSFVNTVIMGVPLQDLPLHDDKVITAAWHDMHNIRQTSQYTQSSMCELESIIIARCEQLAKDHLNKNRSVYVSEAGMPFFDAVLDADPSFVSKEEAWRNMKADPRKTSQLHTQELLLRTTAENIARTLKNKSLTFLDPSPDGVALDDVAPKEDQIFLVLLHKHELLLRDSPDTNSITQVVHHLNERARTLAREKRVIVRTHVLGRVIPDNVSLALDQDEVFRGLEAKLLHLTQTHLQQDEDEIKQLREKLIAHFKQVDNKVREKNRAFLKLRCINPELIVDYLDNDSTYIELELRMTDLLPDARANASDIAHLQDEMSNLAEKFYTDYKQSKRPEYLRDEYNAIPITLLPFDSDPAFQKLENAYLTSKNSTKATETYLQELIDQMHDAADDMASLQKENVLATIIPDLIEGVHSSALNLRHNRHAIHLCAQLTLLQKFERSASDDYKRTEKELDVLLHNLVDKYVHDYNDYLDPAPEGVPLRQLMLDHDSTFKELERQRAVEKSKPTPHAEAVADLEEQLRERSRRLASEVKDAIRSALNPAHLGIPLHDLPLDGNRIFTDMEEQCRDAVAENDDARAQDLLTRLNEHATHIAEQMHDEERANLDPAPEGIPLHVLPLNTDPAFVALENESRSLRAQPTRNKMHAGRLAEINDKLESRARELADESRKRYCDADPEGISLELLRLGNNPDVLKAEEKRRALLREPTANAAQIADVEKLINYMAHEAAAQLVRVCRNALDQNPEGVPLSELPLDKDLVFVNAEQELIRMVAEGVPISNRRAEERLREMDNRVRALATAQKEEDLQGINLAPMGVPLDALKPHEDATFANYIAKLRKLQANPRENASAIAALKADMNERARVLANEMLRNDRGYLDPAPEGVPLRQLMLDHDDVFTSLEGERARLKVKGTRGSVGPIHALEKALNDRVHVIARVLKMEEKRLVGEDVDGFPVELLPLHEDDACVKVFERKRLSSVAAGRTVDLADVEISLLKDRAREVLFDVLRRERSFLKDSYVDIPVRRLPLWDDEEFHRDEVARAVCLLRSGQVASVRAVQCATLERALHGRAEVLAERLVSKDLEDMSEEYLGLPVRMLGCHRLPAFAALVEERALVLSRHVSTGSQILSPSKCVLPLSLRSNRDRSTMLLTLEAMALEQAQTIFSEERAFLEPVYCGVPVELLPLMGDAEFHAAEVERVKLKRGFFATKEVHRIRALELDLHRRAGELALRTRQRMLNMIDQHPLSVPVSLLPLDRDDVFCGLEQEMWLARLRLLSDRNCNSISSFASPKSFDEENEAEKMTQEPVLQALIQAMNARALTLAREERDQCRAELDAYPCGVPLSLLPLDEDAEVTAAEVNMLRARMMQSDAKSCTSAPPAPSAFATASHSTAMLALQEAVMRLACKARHAGRSYLRPFSCGLPLALLPLDACAEVQLAEAALWRGREARANESELNALQSCVQSVVDTLAAQQLCGDRVHYVGREVNGVLLSELPLDEDEVFTTWEVKRALAKAKEEKAIQHKDDAQPPQSGSTSSRDDAHDDNKESRQYDSQESVAQCESMLRTRSRELAAAVRQRWRDYLPEQLHGIPCADLALDDDAMFVAKEAQRWRAHAAPAMRQALEEELLDMAGQAAVALAARELRSLRLPERLFSGPTKRRVLLHDTLQVYRDDEFAAAATRWRRARARQAAESDVSGLEEKVVQRAAELLSVVADENTAASDMRENGGDAHSSLEDIEPVVLEQQQKSERSGSPRDRDFLNPSPRDVPLQLLPLDSDAVFLALESERQRAIRQLSASTSASASSSARSTKRSKDKNSANDPKADADAKQHRVGALEAQLRDRADQLAADFITQERAYLDAEVAGVPLQCVPLDEDAEFRAMELELRRFVQQGARPAVLRDLELQLKRRVYELALHCRRWRDVDFHAANEAVAPLWLSIGELYPEGHALPIAPPNTAHALSAVSAPGDVGYMSSFIAALGTHPVLLQRLLLTHTATTTEPYTFLFFDPESNPVYVDVDDRVPCSIERQPLFTQSLRRLWFPLLLEKAYAKFVGGYSQLDNCTPHETLHDLTGRPVTHIPFDRRLADASNIADFTAVSFWRDVASSLVGGDVFVCMSGEADRAALCGLHPECSYALIAIEEAVEGTLLAEEVVIKLHNAYRGYAPFYVNPLQLGEKDWAAEVRRRAGKRGATANRSRAQGNVDSNDGTAGVSTSPKGHPMRNKHDASDHVVGGTGEGKAIPSGQIASIDDMEDTEDDAVLYLPLPIFLEAFTSMQRCHINCGDRLTTSGQWDGNSGGGNPKFITFRNNPIYLVENKTTRPVTVLAELRHTVPAVVDQDGLHHYAQTGMALLQPINAKLPPTPLLTNGTHRFLQKGMMLDSREVCAEMRIPAHTTCYLVPYLLRAGLTGPFNLSIYPGAAKVTLTPLHHAGLSREPISAYVVLKPGEPGRRVDVAVDGPGEIHVLLQQEKVSSRSSLRKGDTVGENDVWVVAFNDHGIKLTSSSTEATNAREHALVIRAAAAGHYSIVMTSPNMPTAGDCSCLLQIFVSKKMHIKFVPVPANAAPLMSGLRLPSIARRASVTTSSRGDGDEPSTHSQPLQRYTRKSTSASHPRRSNNRARELSNVNSSRRHSIPEACAHHELTSTPQSREAHSLPTIPSVERLRNNIKHL